MNEEDDIERFEEERELELYREYRDVVPMFSYVVETERRFYLANTVELTQKGTGQTTDGGGDGDLDRGQRQGVPGGRPRAQRGDGECKEHGS